jgi:hypothetical protein
METSRRKITRTWSDDCAEKVKKFLPELGTTDITPGKIGRLRNEVRERLSGELKEIDGIVKKVMGK